MLAESRIIGDDSGDISQLSQEVCNICNKILNDHSDKHRLTWDIIICGRCYYGRYK